MLERGDPLKVNNPSVCSHSARTQPLTSEYEDCHMQLWNKPKTSVFANSWRRSRVILIDKHLKPTCSKITSTTHSATIRKRSSVKWAMLTCSSYAKQFRKCNTQNAFFIGIKELSIAFVDISWLKANPAKIFTNGDWMLSQSRTASSRRSDVVVLGTAKLRHRKSTSWPTTLEGDVSKRSFEGIHDRFLRDPTYCDSQLKIGWTEETCIAMDKLAQGDHTYCPLPVEFDRYRKNWFFSLNKSGRNAPMKLRSDFREAVTIMNRLHRESGQERPALIPFHQYQRWHSSSSSSSTSWWQWNEHRWSS